MAKQKTTRKELLKSPDEFLTLTERATNYVREHSRVFHYAGIVVAVAAVLYLGATTYLNHVDKQMRPMLWLRMKSPIFTK
jgi:hypothetical protein